MNGTNLPCLLLAVVAVVVIVVAITFYYFLWCNTSNMALNHSQNWNFPIRESSSSFILSDILSNHIFIHPNHPNHLWQESKFWFKSFLEPRGRLSRLLDLWMLVGETRESARKVQSAFCQLSLFPSDLKRKRRRRGWGWVVVQSQQSLI